MTAKTDKPSAEVRIRVMKRDRFMCTYCGKSGNDTELEVDHIIPASKGGSNHMSNLTTACAKCNRKKGVKGASTVDKYPDKKGIFIHIMKDGRINNQGVIVNEDDEHYWVQLFSFLDGGRTNIIFIEKDELKNGNCIVYGTNEDMVRAYFKECKNHGELEGTINENMEAWKWMK